MLHSQQRNDLGSFFTGKTRFQSTAQERKQHNKELDDNHTYDPTYYSPLRHSSTFRRQEALVHAGITHEEKHGRQQIGERFSLSHGTEKLPLFFGNIGNESLNPACFMKHKWNGNGNP